MCYVGKALHLEGCVDSGHSEVVVLQQHCGGNTVLLYKGKLRAKGRPLDILELFAIVYIHVVMAMVSRAVAM